ncbi:ATP adenylyltransferase-domain-containing protein [Echria macrotheca]|uniref:ATP adenylyltransferase-domain-containing protein n=1 Tax=Echria macrotheca TaxID=438768 RepID=A0AAJ0FDL2_9PEZI|nr:ATP adenylyltransferase-domain-containing protein [Echria macrotheca]
MNVDENELCSRFDRLVDEGVIVFQGYRTVRHSDGIEFQFRLLSGLVRKPVVYGEKPASASTTTATGLRPGSDIDVSGYEVADLGETHMLIFNKFPAARPHLLVLTQDGFRRQHEALDRADIGALWQVLSSFQQGKRYLAIFNCGVESGCSRLHKHMQVFAAPEEDEQFALWPDANNGDGSTHAAVPFRFFLHRFERGFPPADELLKIYLELLGKAETAVGQRSRGGAIDGAVPHNVVLDRRWMLVVPRRAAGLNGIIANSAAALGMIWVANEEQIEAWVQEGPARVMAHVGVPREAASRGGTGKSC